MTCRVDVWGEFLCAATVFLVSHLLPTRPVLRARLIGVLRPAGYLFAYSLISIVTFAWIIAAANRAPNILLWPSSLEGVWIANGLMATAILFAVNGAGIANPFSLGGLKARPFDPARPGFASVTRHPLLWAIIFWAIAHVVANGDLAHVLLFGGAGLMALLGLFAFEARSRRALGARFRELSHGCSVVPFAALVDGRARWRDTLSWRLAAVPAVWAAVIWLHRELLDVSPLPPL